MRAIMVAGLLISIGALTMSEPSAAVAEEPKLPDVHKKETYTEKVTIRES